MSSLVFDTLGIPKESSVGERRVAATPESVKAFVLRGLKVVVERGAGTASGISDEAYVAAGATIADDVYPLAGAIFKVRPPTLQEVSRLNEGALIVAFMYPDRTPGLVEALCAKKATAIALERIPRITRAQKMDLLSSMGNLSGYRAVLEAATRYQGFMGPLVTAAGSTPPARVLIIGAGVAGLAAIGAARALGAEVRAFDTRAAAREQVESLGATFLEVSLKEAGEGHGGYAKVMSEEFIAAEMALFKAQAKEVDIIITTALVPGARAPILLPRDVVEHLKPGSVIVDMAAEQGGNCELCVPGEVTVFQGISIIGYTDLPSRMASTASRLVARNLLNLTGELGNAGTLSVNPDNEVIRPALVLSHGIVLPPLPPKPASPIEEKSKVPPPTAKPAQTHLVYPARSAWGTTVSGLLGLGILFLLGRFAPPDLLQHSTIFVLACFIGWQVIWAVTPALHTPLMSVTNAISGIIIVGGILQVGGTLDTASILGALAIFFASINVAGGFLVTQRMLKMFQRGDQRSSR